MHKLVADEVEVAEDRQQHYERWQWGGRLPSERLRGVRGSNVLGLLTFDSDLVHALDVAGPEVQRSVALCAARRACDAAGLTDVGWVAPALTALAQGRPLRAPFNDDDQMWEILRSSPLVPGPTVLGAMPPERPPYIPPPPAGWTWVPVAEPQDDGATRYELDRLPGSRAPMESASLLVYPGTPDVRGPISQPYFALPAVLAAAEPDPLKAALDAVWHAVHTHGEHYPKLLKEIWAICSRQAHK
ncbi:hypothetical protein ACIPW5_06550 [Streptomyces sp. NPDC090077]|uniref:hypothetical protein n=1 Tax=Streptomyces sp. NPDC090077 TaxID=3365938 RepID=UPI0037F87B5C